MAKLFAILNVSVVLIMMMGCGSSKDATTQDQDVEIKTFSSNQELRDYILDQYAKSILPRYSQGEGIRLDDVMATESPEGDTANYSGSESDTYSQTNVQEQGVDEADKVKHDGRYIYRAGDRSVRIVDAQNPSSMVDLPALDIKGYVNDLYLYGDLLVVLYIPDQGEGQPWDYAQGNQDMAMGLCYWLPVNSQTGIMRVDVSDPASPVIKQETIIDGNLVSSRRISNKLYLVQQFLPMLPQFDYYYDESGDKDDVIAANKTKLDGITLENLIPYYKTTGEDGQETEKIQLVTSDHFYKPSLTSGGSVVTLSTLDLDDVALPIQSTGVIADAHTIYASTQALYIASTRWNDVYYENERYTDIYQTYLFKFSFRDEGAICVGAGSVSGKILNQFSLGEYHDVLRIATTNGESWFGQGEISNAVYCVKEEDGKLGVLGKLEGLAQGEKIYAARFQGTKGYLVTFVQVDPLFTLDLSDPTHPKKSGELKVPGYSTYIHPLSDDYLLTVGQDVSTYEGRVLNQGISMSIFDIRDFENPALVFKESIGDRGTYSEALYNHKALTYWASKNLLAIPVELHETAAPSDPYEWGAYQYSGLFVYRISSDTGFSPLGVIKTNLPGDGYMYSPWMRGIFRDDYVFAVQQGAVYAAPYAAMATPEHTLDLNP